MTPWPYALWLNTPKGLGRVLACVDRGPDADLEWVCVNLRGEIWSALNYDVRVVNNITYGIRNDD
jgi:hypothetical protein